MPNDTESLIREIYAEVREIKTKLESDYRALYGNGHPGLIEDVANLKRDMAILRAKQSWFGSSLAGWLSLLAWLITTAVSILAVLKK